MAKVAIELEFKQFEDAIERLSPEQQKEIARKIWAMRFERLSEKMRRAAKKNKITQKDINKMCEEARQKVYEKYRLTSIQLCDTIHEVFMSKDEENNFNLRANITF